MKKPRFLFLIFSLALGGCLSYPLNKAAQKGDNDAVRSLLTKRTVGRHIDINGTDHEGETALMSALVSKHVETARLLLELGADYKVVNPKNGYTAITYAAGLGETEIVQLLLDKGVDPNTTSQAGPLIMTAASLNYQDEKSSAETIKLLLERGADAKALDNNGFTALMMAANWGNLEGSQLLLAHGADAKKLDQNGNSALYWAMSGTNNRSDLEKLLLEHGALPIPR